MNKIPTDILHLIDAYFDGNLDDAGSARLSEWLHASRGNVCAFVGHAFFHQQLREACKAELLAASFPMPVADEPVAWRRPSARLAIVAALLAAMVGMLGYVFGRSQAQRSVENRLPIAASFPVNTPKAPYIAKFVSLTNTRWDSLGQAGSRRWEMSDLTAVEHNLSAGDEITLHEGIVEFRLEGGVSLSIEGPAAMIVVSPASLILQYGKLTAHVPSHIENFRLLTGKYQIAARNAEFGVDLNADSMELQAFSGQSVTLVMSNEREASNEDLTDTDMSLDVKSSFQDVHVPSGRAMTVNLRATGKFKPRWRNANPKRFATQLSMAGPLPVGQSYFQAILAAKPAGYWRFESQDDGVIRNEMPGGVDLNVDGKLELVGDLHNRMADFSKPGQNCSLISAQPLTALRGNDYTIEVWIKPSHRHYGGIATLITDPKTSQERPSAFLGVRQASSTASNSRIRFVHRDPPSNNPTDSVCHSKTPYAPRRWQHVVAVKQNKWIRMYVDGQLASYHSAEPGLARGLYLLVGRTPGSVAPRRFAGQIDELAVYNRALSPDEVQDHYSLVYPQARHESDDDYTDIEMLRQANGGQRSIQAETGHLFSHTGYFQIPFYLGG